MNAVPYLYNEAVRRFALPAALISLFAWVALLAGIMEVPKWLQTLTLLSWLGTITSIAKHDATGELLRRALAFAGYLLFSLGTVLFIVFDVGSSTSVLSDARGWVLLLLLFPLTAEATYGFLRRSTLGLRWLLVFLPLLAWMFLASRMWDL